MGCAWTSTRARPLYWRDSCMDPLWINTYCLKGSCASGLVSAQQLPGLSYAVPMREKLHELMHLRVLLERNGQHSCIAKQWQWQNLVLWNAYKYLICHNPIHFFTHIPPLCPHPFLCPYPLPPLASQPPRKLASASTSPCVLSPPQALASWLLLLRRRKRNPPPKPEESIHWWQRSKRERG